MDKNVGSIDRNIRIILGIVFLAIGLFTQVGTGMKIGAFAVAAIAFATAYLSFWPLWKVLGISTSKEKKAEETEKPVEKTTSQKENKEEGEGKPAGH